MESYLRIVERGLKNLTYPYMGVGGVKNYQNHPYVINEWPLIVPRIAKRRYFLICVRSSSFLRAEVFNYL